MGHPNGGTKGPKPGKLFLCVMHILCIFGHIIWILCVLCLLRRIWC